MKRSKFFALSILALAALASSARAQLATAELYAEGLTRPAGFFYYATGWPTNTGLYACDETGILPFAQLPGQLAFLDRSHYAAPVASPGQPSVDVARQRVYLTEASGKSRGVWSATRDLNLDPSGRPILVGIIAQGQGLGGSRPTASALGPDGKLYVGFQKSGDLKRIVAPEIGFTQRVESVGKSFKGGNVFALAFVGETLYLAGKDGLQALDNASLAAGGAQARQIAGLPASIQNRPCHGLVSDGADFLYFESNSAIWRYSTQRGTCELYVRSGLLPSGATYNFEFNGGSTAGLMLDETNTLWVGTDPGNGVNFLGRAWRIAPPQP